MNTTPWHKIVWEAFGAWSEDRAARMAAALAYYSTFSLAPLLFLVISLAALVFGDEAARGAIFGELRGTLGDGAALAVEEMLNNAFHAGESVLATVVGIALLVLGASGVFVELQDSLNSIWKVKPKPKTGFLRNLIVNRLLSFSVILGTGFLLLISLVLSAGLSAVSNWFSSYDLPGGPILWQAVQTIVSLLVVTVLFAMIFKILPDVKLRWSDVWVGAAVTAVLFTVGKYLCGLYLAHGSVASAYGAAGTLVVVLLWIYYSALILFFGAEFTRVVANRRGSQVKPSEYARRESQPERRLVGVP